VVSGFAAAPGQGSQALIGRPPSDESADTGRTLSTESVATRERYEKHRPISPSRNDPSGRSRSRAKAEGADHDGEAARFAGVFGGDWLGDDSEEQKPAWESEEERSQGRYEENIQGVGGWRRF